MLSQRVINDTGVREHVLLELGTRLTEVPAHFEVHSTVRSILEARKRMILSKTGRYTKLSCL